MTAAVIEPQRSRKMAVAVISDSRYASRCATMVESASIASNTTVLSLDIGVKKLELYFPGLETVSFDSFLSNYPELGPYIEDRSEAERIFSIGPSFLQHLSIEVEADGWLVYADADLFFFEPLKDYLDKLPTCNVVIAPHRHYKWNQRRLAKYGHFNVGLVAFRKNEEGMRALSFWAERCLEWCRDYPEDGKYADQRYLELFETIAAGIFVEISKGADLAPWNSPFFGISVSPSGIISVKRCRLAYFHAQGLSKKHNRWVLGHLNYLSIAAPRIRELIYTPYLRKLEMWSDKLGIELFGTSRYSSSFRQKLKENLLFFLSLLLGQTVRIEKKRGESNDSNQ